MLWVTSPEATRDLLAAGSEPGPETGPGEPSLRGLGSDQAMTKNFMNCDRVRQVAVNPSGKE